MSTSYHPSSILVVDTHAESATTLARILVQEGFEAEAAVSLGAAVEAIERRVYDLIVSSLLPSDTSGDLFSGASQLRERAAPTPVGIVTGRTLDPRQVAARSFAFVLSKPLELATVLAAVADATGLQLQRSGRHEVALIHRYFAVLSARDWDGLAALCTPDFVYCLPAPGPLGRMVVGRDAFRAYSAEVFEQFPGATFESIVVYELPHGFVARYLSRFRGVNGEACEQAGAVIFRVAGGLLSRVGIELNHERLAALAGLS